MDANFPRILHENDDYLVIDKPPGWLSIPGRVPAERSVLGWLRERHSTIIPVHRIDRETSGLLIFARTESFHREANGWFESHQIEKRYMALAQGVSALPSFQVRTPIEGKRAVTQISVIEPFREAFLAEVRIATGKRHQIRIHLSGEGHPLLGDPRYGGKKVLGSLEISRVALHAAELVLPGGVRHKSELPPDFMSWLNQLRAGKAAAE